MFVVLMELLIPLVVMLGVLGKEDSQKENAAEFVIVMIGMSLFVV